MNQIPATNGSLSFPNPYRTNSPHSVEFTDAKAEAAFAPHCRRMRLLNQSLLFAASGNKHAHIFANFLLESELLETELVAIGLKHLEICTEVELAVPDLVKDQEAAYDSYEPIMGGFQAIDPTAPRHALISSSSLTCSSSKIQTAAIAPQRCFSSYPNHPPHRINIVEISPGELTNPILSKL